MMRQRTWLIVLAVVVGLPLAWLLVRGSWARKSPPVPHRAWTPADAGRKTPSQEGLRLLQGGRPAEALPLLREASRLEPDNAIVLNNLCVAEIQVGELAAAIRNCERAIQLAPDFQLARNNLGWARAEQKRLTAEFQAREEGPAGIRKASEWIAMGMDWYRLAEWDRSLRCFERALQVEPTNAMALNDLGAVWMEKRRPDLALDLFHRALAIDPSNQLARNNLAWARAELEKLGRPSRPPAE